MIYKTKKMGLGIGKLIELGKLFILSLLVFLSINTVSDAASFSLSPTNGTAKAGCESSLSILLDTEGSASNAADAFINFNPAEVEIIDQNSSQPGIQIRPGTIYESYVGNTVNVTEGKIYLTGFSIFLNYIGGPGVYGVIIFKAKPGVNTTNFTFDYTPGSTTDSNIAAMDSSDLLNGVTNSSYTIQAAGFCGTDTLPPSVSNILPAPDSKNNPLDSSITFDVSDNVAVDLDSVRVKIDGVLYTMGLTGFSSIPGTGSALKYSIEIVPSTPFIPDTPVVVEIDAKDTSNNSMPKYIYTFNQPTLDNDAPFVTNPSPVAGTKNVPLDSNILFHVKDLLSGVDLNTVVVNVDGQDYVFGDSNFTYSGLPSDYFVVVDPINDFEEGKAITVRIDAEDLKGNEMNTYVFVFNNPDIDNVPPYVVSPVPVPGSRGVALTSNVSFMVKDSMSGVNLGSITVSINGTQYQNGGSGFSYTPNGKDYSVVIDPTEDFPATTETIVVVNASDLSGNKIDPPYTFKFNKPSVCGDGLVELEEECELPNAPGCGSDCKSILCAVIEQTGSICGDSIVQGEEQCEPPSTGLCGVDCKLTTEEGVKPSELTGMLKLSDEQQSLITAPLDSDSDGLPDTMEQKYNTNSENGDSDGDGVSDLVEIMDLGTNPLIADIAEIHTVIISPENDATIGSKRLVVRGTAPVEKQIKVFAKSVDDGSDFFIGETVSGTDNLFMVLSADDLDQGEYLLRAESYEKNGTLIEVSNQVKVTLDLTKAIAAPTVESLNDVPVVKNMKILIYNNQPIVFGSTEPNSQVFVVFESSIISSTIISDSLTGFFTVYAPKPLEMGDHKVTVYAVSPDGVVSDPITVNFTIGEKVFSLQGFSIWFYLFILFWIFIILAIIYYFYRRRKQKKLEEEKKLLEESLLKKENADFLNDMDENKPSSLFK